MMVDVALELQREEGQGPEVAIREACLRRFRPIMMTTFCACSAASHRAGHRRLVGTAAAAWRRCGRGFSSARR